jgi:hypothetical protein
MSTVDLNEVRLAMYPDEWAWVLGIGKDDKDKARAILKTFWGGFCQDSNRDWRGALTRQAWSEFDG